VNQKILLTEEQETLLITLFCKALPNPIFHDPIAQGILAKIDYDFLQLKVPAQTQLTVRMRAKQIDAYTQSFLSTHPQAAVIHLGCGLDSRFQRLDNGLVSWNDLDLPDVIKLRKNFMTDTDRYHMISASVIDLTWLNLIPVEGQPVMVIAEGLLMYLAEEDVRALFLKLGEKFPGCHLVCDVFSQMTAGRVGRHPSLKKTGAVVRWGIDNSKDLEGWGQDTSLQEEWYFTQSEDIDLLSVGFRLAFKFARLFSAAQKAHRILYITL
jgi:O-methyltransferase involved in polyketide biosynthesis